MSDYDSSDDENVKTVKPCGNYRLDTEGVNFGDCKCGHSKASHMRKSSNKAGAARKALRHGDSDSDSDDEEKAAEPCGKYRVDTQGANFGDCKCGWPKASHGKKGESSVAKAAKSLKARNKSFGATEKGDEPCDNFRVDTSAAEFGTCKCGFKRAEHDKKQENKASEAVQALKMKNKKKNKQAAMIAYDRESVQGKIDAKRDEMAALEAKNKKKNLNEDPAPQEADEAAPAISNGGNGGGGGGGGCCIVM